MCRRDLLTSICCLPMVATAMRVLFRLRRPLAEAGILETTAQADMPVMLWWPTCCLWRPSHAVAVSGARVLRLRIVATFSLSDAQPCSKSPLSCCQLRRAFREEPPKTFGDSLPCSRALSTAGVHGWPLPASAPQLRSRLQSTPGRSFADQVLEGPFTRICRSCCRARGERPAEPPPLLPRSGHGPCGCGARHSGTNASAPVPRSQGL